MRGSNAERTPFRRATAVTRGLSRDPTISVRASTRKRVSLSAGVNRSTRLEAPVRVARRPEKQPFKCPVLLMSGDRDVIRLEHTIKIFNNIENANLFVMPGGSHFGSYQKPELFNMLLMDFFTKPFSKLSTVEIMTGKR